MPDEISEDLKTHFADFLEQAYDDEIERFGSQYPEQRYLRVSWHELQNFNAKLADVVVEQPRECLQELEDALRFHTSHDAAYLPNARAVFCDGPRAAHLNELGAEDIGRFLTVIARIKDVDGPRSNLEVGYFRCRDCESATEVQQQRSELMRPRKCRSCERRRVDFVLKHGKSKYVDTQTAVLEDLESLVDGGYPLQMDAEFKAQAAGTISAGDWVKISGVVGAELIENSTNVDLRIEGWAVTPLPRQEVAENSADLDLFTPPEIELTEQHLSAFTEHVDRLLAEFGSGDSMNEEEVKLKIITPLIELLGWDIHSPEVRMEREDRRGGQLDYALQVDDEPKVCVEAKQTNSLQRADREQIQRYMINEGIEWGLLTDGVDYELFRIETGKTSLIFSASYEVIAEYFAELSNIARECFSSAGGQQVV
jgi:hypothetical protein